jgi:NAD-dependent deacetylase sirtuin 7
VTEKTSLYRHKTERFCHKCESELTDTIVHFGEKSRPDSVYQWPPAADWVEKADTILCLGSSLKVCAEDNLQPFL